MLMAIDCGNTNTVFSIWDGRQFLATWRTATDHRRTADQYYVWLDGLMKLRHLDVTISEVIISSTVPRVVFNLRVLCNRYYDCRPLVVGKPECQLPHEPRVDAGTLVGPDRLVNTAGAFDRHGGDLIVVDFGTATTFDVVDTDGAYVGGVIAPGVNLSMEALHMAAAALPHVDVTKPDHVVGRNTVACMQSGIFWGYVGLVKEVCNRIRAERDRPMRVIGTGGLAPLFATGEDLFDTLEDDLTMHGLRIINDYNKDLAKRMTDRLIYLPLGGAGEIGMNAYVFGYGPEGKERLILVDLGVTFGDMETSPGIDLIMPDISWLADRVDRLEAIFITHAHEDHVGAVGHLWPRLKVPIYARAFTGRIAQLKLEEAGLPVEAVKIVEPRPDVVEAGPFRVSFLPLSHSIPESSALIIDTPAGRVVHSGDFKLDGTPVVGDPFDPMVWHAMAREGEGVKVFTCDSTNIFTRHPGRSEATLAEPLRDLVAGAPGMVVATTFASNIARLKTLADAGVAAGRSVCLMGRAMRRMVSVGQETGVLKGFPPTISPEDAADVPRENLLLIVTGSQGERRAASAQLARGKYLGIEMKEGDLFLFSSRTIPGNERGVIRIMNAFSEAGVDVHDDEGGLYHVSGHANRPDIEAVHDLISPRAVVPIHGEHRHLREHAKLVAAKGIPAEIAVNGTMLDLTGDVPEIVEYVETGRVYLDGSVLIGAMDGVVRDRIRLSLNGHVMVTVIIDEENEVLGDPWAEITGLPLRGRNGVALEEAVERALADLLDRIPGKVLGDDGRLDEAIRRQVRQTAMQEIGKKPEVTVVVSRLLED